MGGELDTQALLALPGGDDEDGVELIREMVATFLSDTPNKLERLRGAARDVVRGDVHLIAHTLKSMSAWLGAMPLSSAAAALEAASHAGDPATMRDLTLAVVERYERVRPELERILASLGIPASSGPRLA